MLEAARSRLARRLARRARAEEARAATTGDSPGFCAGVQQVLRLYVEQGGDLQALLAPARARPERAEEARAATSGDSPRFCAGVQPVLRLYVEQGGDLQALLAPARVPVPSEVVNRWAASIEAAQGNRGGVPRCPLCKAKTRGGSVSADHQPHATPASLQIPERPTGVVTQHSKINSELFPTLNVQRLI